MSSLSKIHKIFKKQFYKFSPLYDNGSSLGRELDDVRINELLTDEEKFQNFIDKGKPDIRWDDKHLNHFELIKTIRIDFYNEVNTVINNLKLKYNKKVLANIVNSIDNKTPSQFNHYRIPSNRKEFLIKYIDARINRIIEIIDDEEQV